MPAHVLPPPPVLSSALFRAVLLVSGVLGLGSVSSPASAKDPQTVQQPARGYAAPLPAPRYSKAEDGAGQLRITADFVSAGGAPVSLSFRMQRAVSRSSMQEFGLSTDEIEALRRACRRSGACDQAEFDQRLMQYFQDHKLRLRTVPGQRSHLFVDIPQVVRETHAHVRPVAEALQALAADQGRDARWMLEAAVGLVQAGLAYRVPASIDAGRQTLGFYTPARALESGYGDCDTKSALLASILLNLGQDGIIGVRVPDHYLLGIRREPRDGEAFVTYREQTYVLIEAAGPAVRRPGEVSERTRTALRRGQDIRIDPIS